MTQEQLYNTCNDLLGYLLTNGRNQVQKQREEKSKKISIDVFPEHHIIYMVDTHSKTGRTFIFLPLSFISSS